MAELSGELDAFLEVASHSATEPIIEKATGRALEYNARFRDTTVVLDHDAKTKVRRELDKIVGELMNVDTQVVGTIFYNDSEGRHHTQHMQTTVMQFRGYRFLKTPDDTPQRIGYGFEINPKLLEVPIDEDELTNDGLFDVSSELGVALNFTAMSGLRAEALMQMYMPNMLYELNTVVKSDDMTHSEKLLALRTISMPRGVDFSFTEHRTAVQSYLAWMLPIDKKCPYVIQAKGIAIEHEKKAKQPFIVDDTNQLIFLKQVVIDKDINDQYCLQLDTRFIAPKPEEPNRNISLPLSTINLISSLREQTYLGY